MQKDWNFIVGQVVQSGINDQIIVACQPKGNSLSFLVDGTGNRRYVIREQVMNE